MIVESKILKLGERIGGNLKSLVAEGALKILILTVIFLVRFL